MSAGKVKNQPKSQAEFSLREAIRMEGDPDMAAMRRVRGVVAKRIQSPGAGVAAQNIANSIKGSSSDIKVHNSVAHRKKIIEDVGRAPSRSPVARPRKKSVSVNRSASRGASPSGHAAERNRAAEVKRVPLKLRESVRQAFRMADMRVESVARNDRLEMTFAQQSLGVDASRVAIQLARAQSLSAMMSGATAVDRRMESVCESIVKRSILRAAKIKAAVRESIVRVSPRMVKIGAVAVKSDARGQSVKVSKIASVGSKARLVKTRVQRHHVLAMPQHAQLLAMFRAQSSMSRGRVSGQTGTSAQRVAVTVKKSTSMVMGVAAQQTNSAMQTKAAAPYISSRAPAALGNRSPGIINPMLATPVPVGMDNNGNILSGDKWINDGSLYSLINHIDPEIADAFFECLLKQLQKGPASLAKSTLRQKANKCLKKGTPTINAITWASMLQEVLLQAMHHVKIFDDTGIRGSAAVRADAAMLLDIDDELFSAWEDSFCMNAIAWNLSVDNKVPVEDRFPKHQDVMLSVEQQIIRRSGEAFAKDDYQSALLHTFETKVQWKAARCSAIDNGEHKVAASVDLILQLAKKDRPAVARMMTIIVRHSSINKRKMARDIFVPRWSVDDLRSLIIKLTKEHVGVVSDNYFRSQLTAWENASLNELILNANHENAKARMKRLSPKQPIQDFVELLEKSDQEDEVLHDIWEDIARNFSKMN